MSSLMIKKLRKGNAIPLLLSRINKAKVYRGREREPGESQKSSERSPVWVGCLCREETNTSGHEAGEGSTVRYSTAQSRLAAELLCSKFCLWSPVSDRTGKHARSWWSLPASFWGSDKRERRGSDTAASAGQTDTAHFVLVPAVLLPSCTNKLPASTREAVISA